MRIAAAVAALLTVAVSPAAQIEHTIVLEGHYAPGGSRYQYLPFDLPANAEAITISYSFTGDDDGASVVDLGLFEPGPLTLGTDSFRGYSGGAQRTITVGRQTASPGYRTGPMPPGTWHVMLGLYKIAPAGVDVQITIGEAKDERVIQGSPSVHESPARKKNDHWYSGALHLHTKHSDGTLTPAALSDAVRSAGFDFFVITDHNNTTHTREPLAAFPLHIVGEEITTPAGHAGAWGLPEGGWIDFRVLPNEPDAAAHIRDFVSQAHGAGALFAINHPVDNCAGCSWEQTIPDDVDAVEVWQNERAPRPAEIAFWDRLLRSGRRVTAVGVSDWHRLPARIGTAAVRVLADELTQSSILEGIRRGHVIVMRDAETAPPAVKASCGGHHADVGDALTCSADDMLTMTVAAPEFAEGRVEFIWNAARLTTLTVGHGAAFSMPANAGYLRAHLYAADGTPVAITNPIYVTTR